MAERYGAVIRIIERTWGEVFAIDEIETALKVQSAKLLAIVHAETSTGVLQPLEGIAEVVHQYGGLLGVDCVTSLGGVEVEIDKWCIDAAYSGTQKALSCPPGLASLTLGERAVEALSKRKTKVANWYLDMSLLERYWGDQRTYHHTAPISMNYALCEALRLVLEEGLEARFARHRKNARSLWGKLSSLGLKPHVKEEHRLPTLTTVRIPEGLNEMDLRRRLLHEYNIEIAGGLGDLKGRVLRIGLMGYSSRLENVVALTGALKEILVRA
jgi:alanine-glyoxylate transaminase/serine-glyoxylate transaminase/serine-pyruvate transaminase